MNDTEYAYKQHELGDVKDWNIVVSGRYGKQDCALAYEHSFEGYKRGGTTFVITGPYPERVVVRGDITQARWVARTLSDAEAGCEYFWVVEGDPE